MTSVHYMGYVLDASVVAKWFLYHEEKDVEKALALREAHVSGRLVLSIPDFAFLEILNAIRFHPKAQERDGAKALHLLKDLNLQTRAIDYDLIHQANRLAWAHKTTLYDAIYVALAEELAIPLVTADEVFVRKMQGHRLVLRLLEL